ncbi:hypothetical protein [Thermoflavifilum thermophilum]|uniref:Uncharacterized protein n=1 Tax=Thermoflavifilum thermophilum TaxID=1393122 RepID=A0A1I7N8P0_9BACT|nr:hypothetical protein [Thermoflavifilum thermophilum]SFV31021.1 hypothetical protein SAMN05660895_0957 [Thermoflavifilum thermophilum]
MKHKWIIIGLCMFMLGGISVKAFAQHRDTDWHHRQEIALYREGHGHMPPGLMKKIYGERSARCFAPGHRKWHEPRPVYVVPAPVPVVYAPQPQPGVHVWISAQAGF